jgi:hypothetical protein
MVRGKAVATVAALQARAGGAEGPAPILLAGYDPVLVTRGTGRRMNSRAHDEVRDGPPNKFGGIDAKDAPANRMGRIARNAAVPAANGGEIASSVPAEVRARTQSAYDGGDIASSVPAEIRVQTGHSGTWIASSVPAEIRARAQSAYKEAYTRAYRAYLGASPAAGDPTATPRAGDPPPPVDSCEPPCDPGNWQTDPPPPDMEISCCGRHCKDDPNVRECERLREHAQCCQPWFYIVVSESPLSCSYSGYCCDPEDPQSPCCTDPLTNERCDIPCSKTICSRSFNIWQESGWVCGYPHNQSAWVPTQVEGTCWNCGPDSCESCLLRGYTSCPGGGGGCNYLNPTDMTWSSRSQLPSPCLLRTLTCESTCE